MAEEIKTWSAEDIILKVNIAGEEVTVEDIESITYDDTNSDSPIDTVDGGAVGIQKTIDRHSGSFTLKATSTNILTLQAAKTDHADISITIQYSDGQPFSSTTFWGGRITSVRLSNAVVDGTPTYAFDWFAIRAEHT